MDPNLNRDKTFYIAISHVPPEIMMTYTRSYSWIKEMFYYVDNDMRWCYVFRMKRTIKGRSFAPFLPEGTELYWIAETTYTNILHSLGYTRERRKKNHN